MGAIGSGHSSVWKLLLHSAGPAYPRDTRGCSFRGDVGFKASGGGGEGRGAAAQTL